MDDSLKATFHRLLFHFTINPAWFVFLSSGSKMSCNSTSRIHQVVIFYCLMTHQGKSKYYFIKWWSSSIDSSTKTEYEDEYFQEQNRYPLAALNSGISCIRLSGRKMTYRRRRVERWLRQVWWRWVDWRLRWWLRSFSSKKERRRRRKVQVTKVGYSVLCNC